MRYLSIFFLAVFLSCQTKEKDTTPPNILFIMADDHARQAISAYGHPISELAPTPNIDQIAEEGALFVNNFVTNSICGPSRAVILTGKHSHINGFRMNGERFDGSQQTFPKLLQGAGYTTGIVGKWHLHGHPQGFDYWKIINDQGHYYNPQYIMRSEEGSADTSIIEGYVTDIITRQAIDFLDEYADSDKPFMLMMHHKAPHRNWMPALRHINRFDSTDFPLPDTYFTDHEGSEASLSQQQTIYKDMYEGYDLKLSKAPSTDELWPMTWTTDFDRLTPEQRKEWNDKYHQKNEDYWSADLHGEDLAKWKGQRYLEDYLSTIASVDESVGQVLDYLEASGLDENTIVIYTTDQGFYLGEKGWFDKRYMYEPSLAMPLLVKYPGHIRSGVTIRDLTQNLDFAETFLDYAGVEIPADMQGQSLRPLLEEEQSEPFRDAIYYHYYDFPAFHMVSRHYGVRTDRYKLIHFYDGVDAWELYDLKDDPDEVSNLIDSPDHQEIRTQLMSSLRELSEKYEVTDNEYLTSDPEKVEKAYENFKRIRNKGISYDPVTGEETRF